MAAAAAGQPADPAPPEELAGLYSCQVKVGDLYLQQTLTPSGQPTWTSASWVQPGALYYRKGAAREPVEPSYMTISVDSREAPARGDPGWFDIGNARVQITIVTRKKLRGPAIIQFRRPSRKFEHYEPAMEIVAANSRALPHTNASLPYRVFAAFAEEEKRLEWHLLRWIGGDAQWEQVEEGHFDLAKADAFVRAVDAARPALAAKTANYRRSCPFLAATPGPPREMPDIEAERLPGTQR
jgi:hypothetical protein